jgi:D-serine deaminase-like pyridoxal phosphate-dependent protein
VISRQRGAARRAAAAALAACALLAGCAVQAPPARVTPPPSLDETAGRTLVEAWQVRVEREVQSSGTADPAVLAQLPALRAQNVLRPGQIVYTATDVAAQFAERDGYDVAGLLLDRVAMGGTTWYVFVVGCVARREYRALGVVDLRMAALGVRDGRLEWRTGSADPGALARYRGALDPSAAPRFPSDYDRFRVVACPAGLCAEEGASGARWALALPVR